MSGCAGRQTDCVSASTRPCLSSRRLLVIPPLICGAAATAAAAPSPFPPPRSRLLCLEITPVGKVRRPRAAHGRLFIYLDVVFACCRLFLTGGSGCKIERCVSPTLKLLFGVCSQRGGRPLRHHPQHVQRAVLPARRADRDHGAAGPIHHRCFERFRAGLNPAPAPAPSSPRPAAPWCCTAVITSAFFINQTCCLAFQIHPGTHFPPPDEMVFFCCCCNRASHV